MDIKRNRYNPYGTEQDELPQPQTVHPDTAISATPAASLLPEESFDSEDTQSITPGKQLEMESGLIIHNQTSRLEIAEYNWFGYNSKTLLVGEKNTINFSLGAQGMSSFSFDYFALHNSSTVINFYDASGKLIGSEKLLYTGSVTSRQFEIKTLSFTAPAGTQIARAELISGDEPGVGDYGFHIDNIKWGIAGPMPVDFTFDLMSKDTGSSASDFVTKDGSANRKVEGTLSRALSSGETLQFWNGSAWVNASVTGLKWQAQDGTAHSASWEYKLRVIDAGGNTTPEQSQQVVLDVTASDVQVIFDHMEKDDGAAGDWKTSDGSAGRKVSGSLSKALSAGDVAEYSLDGGKTWQKLTVSGTGWSFTDTGSHSASWQYQVRIVDIAGNASAPATQDVTLLPGDISFTFTQMAKDTGSSASDFVTKDGSANRKVEGTLSRALSSGETLQFWNGSAWVNASVTGLKWQAQDGTAHSASWEYKLRVIDAGGNTTPEQSQQVVLDVTPSDVQVIFDHMEKDDGAAGDWKTSDGSAGRKVSGSLSKALSAGDVAEYSLDGGKTWQKLTVSGTGWSFTDTGSHSASWQYQVRIVDIAGNASAPATQNVTLLPGDISFTFTQMAKDTGSSASDFVTKDGSANRKVEGTLSRALSSGETLQFWNGSAWVNASVTGLKWQAQDGTAHSASWEYKLRVIDAGGNTTPEQSQQVVLDVTASDVQVIFDHMEKDDGAAGDWKTSDGSAGRKVSGSLSKALSAGDVAEYSLDGGKTWQKLTVSGTSWSFTDTGSHSASWQYQVRIVDIAGNTSVPVQQTVTYVPPVSFKLEITEVWDNEGGLVQIPRNGTTDDHTPLLKGTGEPGEHIIFWIFDATNNKDIFMDGLRAVIKSDGTWELEIPKPLPAGEYSFTASYISSFVMAKWWNLTIVDEISVTITGMAKDTGSSASDFITKDGTAGRKVEGTLSRALASGEKLELWNGKKWVSASVTGLKWQAQDSSAHSASWEYKVRVVDSSGKTAAEKSQQVVLDTTPSDVKLTFMNMSMDDGVDTNDWKTSNGSAGRKVSGSLSKALDAGDVAEYSLDGGKTWLKLAVNGTSWSFTDTGSHSADWQYQVRITDIAGNVSAPVTQDVILEKPEPITFTFTRMDKDTGKSTTDFVTKDGTANRKVEGTLSRALKAGEKLELWDGVKWVAATANGLKWQAQDSIVHTGNWQYKLRVVDGAGNATPELSQQVVFDNKAPTGRVDISSMEKDDGNDIYDFITSDGSKGRKVFGWADKLNADEFIEYSLDGGKTWKSATMIHSGYEFKDNTAHSSSWEYQVRITDLAGNSSAPVKQAVTFVPPTKFVFTEAWDDEGTSVLAPQFATIDDNTPRFKGTGGEPGKAIVIWATNTGTGQQTAVGRGIANSDGTWEIELNKALKAGKYEFYAVYEASNIAAENYWHLTIVNANSITISSMEKDSGISQSDFITNDGSAGRQVSGSITKALTSGQKVQLWNGSAWVNATVNGLKWTAVDSTSHSGNWSYKARIIDGSNNVHAEKSQSVLLDKTTIPALIDYAQEPGTVKVTHWGKTNDSTPTLHGKVEPNAIVYIEFGLDSRWPWHPGGSVKANAKGEWEWTCPEKLDADTWDFQMKYTDIAGNASEWSPQFTLIIEKQADSGGGGDSGGGLEWGWGGAGNGAGDIKGFSEQNISLGINSLSLSGQEQSLNLADVHGHINRLDTVDITGSGDNHLTLSANDVLVLGEESLFIDDGKKQIQIKGNEGDSATLARQLDNFDSNDWRAEEGKITSAGVEYTVWHHQHSDAEVLIQVGIKTEFD